MTANSPRKNPPNPPKAAPCRAPSRPALPLLKKSGEEDTMMEEEEMSRSRMRVGTIFVFRSVHPGQGATENYAQAAA